MTLKENIYISSRRSRFHFSCMPCDYIRIYNFLFGFFPVLFVYVWISLSFIGGVVSNRFANLIFFHSCCFDYICWLHIDRHHSVLIVDAKINANTHIANMRWVLLTPTYVLSEKERAKSRARERERDYTDFATLLLAH